jgi:hypothetical protein
VFTNRITFKRLDQTLILINHVFFGHAIRFDNNLGNGGVRLNDDADVETGTINLSSK